jgi:FKBP-type peptidyl-prolyl cis-trans isomerase
MSTPIEVLFHHSANCSCEQCQKALKPFRNGKFLSPEELEQINNDIQTLVKENQKLHAMLEKLTEEKIVQQQKAAVEAEAAAAVEEEKREAAAEEEPKSAANPRNLTITIDTSNLIYIVVIVVLLIMVMKK